MEFFNGDLVLNHHMMLSFGFTCVEKNNVYLIEKYVEEKGIKVKKVFAVSLENGEICSGGISQFNSRNRNFNLTTIFQSGKPFIFVEQLQKTYKDEMGMDLVTLEITQSTQLNEDTLVKHGFTKVTPFFYNLVLLEEKLHISYSLNVNVLVLACGITNNILYVEKNVCNLETLVEAFKKMTGKELVESNK